MNIVYDVTFWDVKGLLMTINNYHFQNQVTARFVKHIVKNPTILTADIY